MTKPVAFIDILKHFATQIRNSYQLGKTAEFHPEDQLKTPVAELIKALSRRLLKFGSGFQHFILPRSVCQTA